MTNIQYPQGRKFTIVGDLHGQFLDLLHIFEFNGKPSSETPYLFNGDFVDRGEQSLEVILTLFSLHILYPNDVYLNRGNHENENISFLIRILFFL